MKVKLLETVQGAGISGTLIKSGTVVTSLEPGGVYEVDDSLGAWLLEHKKAEEVDAEPAHYGAQKEPALRHDDEILAAIEAARVALDESDVPEEGRLIEPDADIMTTQNQATTKRGKRGKK